MNVYIYNFVGVRIAEYEVFVQYYNRLRMIGPLISMPLSTRLQMTGFRLPGLPGSYSYNLYGYHRRVGRSTVNRGKYHPDTDLLLAIIAMELHCGRTSLFYEMLERMKECEQNMGLARAIQQKVETYDPHNSHGMCTGIHIATY